MLYQYYPWNENIYFLCYMLCMIDDFPPNTSWQLNQTVLESLEYFFMYVYFAYFSVCIYYVMSLNTLNVSTHSCLFKTKFSF